MNNEETGVELRQKLNRETARIAWTELERFYAQGAVIEVSSEHDLVEVAAMVAEDDSAKIASLMSAGGLARVVDQRASQWQENQTSVWAVVVAPWVLVQDRSSNDR